MTNENPRQMHLPDIDVGFNTTLSLALFIATLALFVLLMLLGIRGILRHSRQSRRIRSTALKMIANDDMARVQPFGGFAPTLRGNQRILTGNHLLVSGGTGSGKTLSVLAPATCMWDGAVLAVSSKPDLYQLCAETRARNGGDGRTYVLDLSSDLPDRLIPEGVQRVWLDPCRLILSDDDALDMASALTGHNESSSDEGDFWRQLSIGPFAALLRAAGEDGIAWVIEASKNYGMTSNSQSGSVSREDIYKALDQLPSDGEGDIEPSWVAAISRLESMGSDLAREIYGAFAKSEKHLQSIALYVDVGATPWKRSTIGMDDTTPRFTPAMLQHPRASVFMIAPADGLGSGAAVSVVETLIRRWRQNQTEKHRLPKLLFVLDELCNTVPLKNLPTLVTETRAMGVCILGAVQSTLQFARRYGTIGMQELRDVYPATLVLPGATETELFDQVKRNRDQLVDFGLKPPPIAIPAQHKGQGVLLYKAPPDDTNRPAMQYQMGATVTLKMLQDLDISLPPIDKAAVPKYLDPFSDEAFALACRPALDDLVISDIGPHAFIDEHDLDDLIAEIDRAAEVDIVIEDVGSHAFIDGHDLDDEIAEIYEKEPHGFDLKEIFGLHDTVDPSKTPADDEEALRLWVESGYANEDRDHDPLDIDAHLGHYDSFTDRIEKDLEIFNDYVEEDLEMGVGINDNRNGGNLDTIDGPDPDTLTDTSEGDDQ